jgi:hypothetical protein
MTEDILVVLKSLVDIARRREFHESFAIRTSIAMRYRHMNALLALSRLTLLEEVDDVLGRGIPWKATKLNDVSVIAVQTHC